MVVLVFVVRQSVWALSGQVVRNAWRVGHESRWLLCGANTIRALGLQSISVLINLDCEYAF